MDLNTARNILTGKIILNSSMYTLSELLMLSLNACLTDEGDIICLECNRPNECCECQERKMP